MDSNNARLIPSAWTNVMKIYRRRPEFSQIYIPKSKIKFTEKQVRNPHLLVERLAKEFANLAIGSYFIVSKTGSFLSFERKERVILFHKCRQGRFNKNVYEYWAVNKHIEKIKVKKKVMSKTARRKNGK